MVQASKDKIDLATTIEKLKHPEDGVRMSALAEILAVGAAPDAVREVAECLNDPSERVKRTAVAVLGEAGPLAIPMLAKALNEEQPCTIRMLAASILARFGDAASAASDDLIECLGAEDETLRQVAALALGKIGSKAVPRLRKLLLSPESPARIAAAEALGYIGPDAAEALNDLRHITKSEAPLLLRLSCAASALNVHPDLQNELSFILEVLRDGDEAARLSVLEKFGKCRSSAESAVFAVIDCFREESHKIRASAALAAARIAPQSQHAAASLLPLLVDRDRTVRLNAVIAISVFSANALPLAIENLQRASKEEDSRIAAAAIATIKRISPKPVNA